MNIINLKQAFSLYKEMFVNLFFLQKKLYKKRDIPVVPILSVTIFF